MAISENKDATISPRLYVDNQILLQTEYRQVNSESNHIADFSILIKKMTIQKVIFFIILKKT